MLAGPEMLGHDAFILNRHHIARKAHHARAAFTVPCIERQPCIDRRSEEHTSELQSLMRISYAVFCLKKKILTQNQQHSNYCNIENPYNYQMQANKLLSLHHSTSL